ncbi:MAG: ATP-binding cassette domain-containing protein [Chloroflexota bacterium]
MQPLLKVTGLSGGYDPVRVFQKVSMTMKAGTNIGLFGPNGHGKTTFLKTLSGVLDPWEGSITFLGRQLNTIEKNRHRVSRNFNYDALQLPLMSPKKVVGEGLIQVPQGNLLFPELTIQETLTLAGGVSGTTFQTGKTLSFVKGLFPILGERHDQKIKSLSGGERQMVAIGVGLMGRPKLLILDEPTLGLAPKVKLHLKDAIKTITESGIPIILVEQDIELLLNSVDTLYLFDHGNISAPIRKEDMPDQHEIMDMYFGNERPS